MISPMDGNELERRRWNDDGWTAMWPKRERFTDARRLDLELPEDSLVDDAQLRFIGIAPERMDEARAAVDAHMAQFRLPSGLNRFPLAFQIVTAARSYT